jgi:hypothetical protein
MCRGGRPTVLCRRDETMPLIGIDGTVPVCDSVRLIRSGGEGPGRAADRG